MHIQVNKLNRNYGFFFPVAWRGNTGPERNLDFPLASDLEVQPPCPCQVTHSSWNALVLLKCSHWPFTKPALVKVVGGGYREHLRRVNCALRLGNWRLRPFPCLECGFWPRDQHQLPHSRSHAQGLVWELGAGLNTWLDPVKVCINSKILAGGCRDLLILQSPRQALPVSSLAYEINLSPTNLEWPPTVFSLLSKENMGASLQTKDGLAAVPLSISWPQWLTYLVGSSLNLPCITAPYNYSIFKSKAPWG